MMERGGILVQFLPDDNEYAFYVIFSNTHSKNYSEFMDQEDIDWNPNTAI